MKKAKVSQGTAKNLMAVANPKKKKATVTKVTPVSNLKRTKRTENIDDYMKGVNPYASKKKK